MALKDVDQACVSIPAQSVEWQWRFRVLKAEILVWRGLNQEAFSLLEESPPAVLDRTDVAARRMIVRGMALDYLHKPDQARLSLDAAEQLAASFQLQLLGDVAQARGNLLAHSGNFPDARGAFQKALDFARKDNQLFLEANAMGSLGYVDMWQERYDEAVDWFRKSYRLAESLSAEASSAKTLGNLGWSYYALGDFEDALSHFKQAEAASYRAGLVSDRIFWLIYAGSASYDQGDLASAEAESQQALALAKDSLDYDAMIECRQNLALISLKKNTPCAITHANSTLT